MKTNRSYKKIILFIVTMAFVCILSALIFFNASKNSYDLIQYSIHKIDIPNIQSGTDIYAELNDFFYADKRYIYELNIKKLAHPEIYGTLFSIEGIYKFDYDTGNKTYIKNDIRNKSYTFSVAMCNDEVFVLDTFSDFKDKSKLNAVLLSFDDRGSKKKAQIKDIVDFPVLVSCGGYPIVIFKTKSGSNYEIKGLRIENEKQVEIFSIKCDKNTSMHIASNFGGEKFILSYGKNGVEHIVAGNKDGLLFDKINEDNIGLQCISGNLAIGVSPNEEQGVKIIFFDLNSKETDSISTYKPLSNFVRISEKIFLATDYAYNPYIVDLSTGKIEGIDFSVNAGIVSFSEKNKKDNDNEAELTGIRRGANLKFFQIENKKIIIEVFDPGNSRKDKEYYIFAIKD